MLADTGHIYAGIVNSPCSEFHSRNATLRRCAPFALVQTAARPTMGTIAPIGFGLCAAGGPPRVSNSTRLWGGYAERRRAQPPDPGPRRILADFLIGAHALQIGSTLLTLDMRTYRAAFPALSVFAPQL